MSEASEKTVDTLIGMRVPRDDEPAYVIRCHYRWQTMPRYFFAMLSLCGPITVALHHAKRYPTKRDALGELELLRARGPAIRWSLRRLRASGRRAMDLMDLAVTQLVEALSTHDGSEEDSHRVRRALSTLRAALQVSDKRSSK